MRITEILCEVTFFWGAESREARAESRESRSESREPRAEKREPRAESREARAEKRELNLSLVAELVEVGRRTCRGAQ